MKNCNHLNILITNYVIDKYCEVIQYEINVKKRTCRRRIDKFFFIVIIKGNYYFIIELYIKIVKE